MWEYQVMRYRGRHRVGIIEIKEMQMPDSQTQLDRWM